ncbi:unnamed protein product [Brachionus calyciflorus]|uniref:Uncharacterized protein n=1 Tax=Brachionus calyciflorus TaxID=104777 RepID=A0A813TPR1_9BILA|nr:unnamed protein product [Brachionus calyciflorus]
MREYKFLQVDKMEEIKDFLGILNMPEKFSIDYRSGESKAENFVKNEREIEEKKAKADVEQNEDKPPAAPYRPRSMGGTGFTKTFRHSAASDEGSWRIKPEECSSSNDWGLIPVERDSTNFWRRETQDKKILVHYRGRGPRKIRKEARSKSVRDENIDEDFWRSLPQS